MLRWVGEGDEGSSLFVGGGENRVGREGILFGCWGGIGGLELDFLEENRSLFVRGVQFRVFLDEGWVQ